MDVLFSFFFFNDTATAEIYTLSLHDALPIADSLYCPDLGYLSRQMKLLDRRLHDGHDLVLIACDLLAGSVDLLLELALAASGGPVELITANVQNKAAVYGRIDHDFQSDIIGRGCVIALV